MKKTKKLCLTYCLATFTALSLLSVAVQAVEVDGGTWNYGYGVGNAYSHYYHGKNYHGAKVVNRNNGTKNEKNAHAGVWAKASISNIWDPASFYYKPNGGY